MTTKKRIQAATGILLILLLLSQMQLLGMAEGSTTCIDDVHDWGQWTVIEKPTCKKPGKRVRYCRTDSTHTESEVLPALGGEHTPGKAVRENERIANCGVAGGYDSVEYCITCGEEISRETITIPATGIHVPADAVKENEKDATCGAEGSYDSVVYCGSCGRELSRAHVIVPATGAHVRGSEQLENDCPASCTEAGSYDSVFYCTKCGTELSREHVTVKAKGHSVSVRSSTVEPTCTTAGGILTPKLICKVCGVITKPEKFEPTEPALGHQLIFVPGAEPGAAGEDGQMAHYACERCGALFRDAEGEQSIASRDSLTVRSRSNGSLEAFEGKILENYGDIQKLTGTIEANYGTVAVNEGNILRQFYNMTTHMEAGAYSVEYDGSFQSVQTGDAGCHMFLEAGQSGIITLNAAQGSRITKVTYTLNGEELTLEALGGGQYRITAPGMPTGPEGFAFNEGCLHVETEADPDAADSDSWKSQNLRRLESDNKAINLLKIIDADRSANKDQRAVRIEGMDLDAADSETLRVLASRSDIMNVIADAAYSRRTGTVVFMLENGAKIICDMEQMSKLIVDLLPKVNYKEADPEESKENTREKILQEIANSSESTQQKMDSIQTILVFKYETERVRYEDKPKPVSTQRPIVQAEDAEKPKKKSCLTPDTLIMLADGSEKRVDGLEAGDRLLVWDFDNGCLTEAPLTFFHAVREEAPVLRVSFSDGTSVGIVEEHAFFDLTDRQFVTISTVEQEEYLKGHSFAKLTDGQITEVTLTGIAEDGAVMDYYSPVTEAHFNCFANGMLNISGFMEGLYNVFALEEDALKYDAGQKAEELQLVGELPYEVFQDLFSRELYERNNVGWISVSVAKNMVRLRDLYDLFDFCGPFFVENGSAE